MRQKVRATFLVLIALLLTSATPPSIDGKLSTFHTTALRFELNQGQTDSQVMFISRGSNYTLFLTPSEATLRLAKRAPQGSVVRMQFGDGRNIPRITGVEELPGKTNYFIGNDPQKWQTNVPAYAKVRYDDVYPGVDLLFYGNDGYLEHDFIVKSGADPAKIVFTVDGGKVAVNKNGDLIIGENNVRFQKAVIYQQIHGIRREVSGGFAVRDDGGVGFTVGKYNAAEPLIIDPVFVYSSYLGGGEDENRGSNSEIKRADIAADASGNTYVIGTTESSDFPTANGVQNAAAGSRCSATTPTVPPVLIPVPCPEAFVVKLSPTGSIIYSTFLGGSGLERGYGIAIDSSGSVYVAGRTQSDDFPTVNALSHTLRGGEDAFIARLNSEGSALIFSTYFGGSSPDDAVAIAVDSAGNACVVGETQSRDLPTTAAFQSAFGGGGYDAYVAKISPGGSSIIYASYLGGRGEDDVEDVAVDLSGNALVVGVTNSTDFPTTSPLQPSFRGVIDATVVKLGPTGQLIGSTYLGGSGPDYATAVALSSDGQIYVTGITESSDFPVANELRKAGSNFGTDAFVTKFDPTLSSILYSTYLGGSGEDIPYGIAVDAAGNVHLAGTTTSTDFPTVSAIQASRNGVRDAFLVTLNPSGSQFIYSSYLGGSNLDYAFGIAVDPAGNRYLTGMTLSTDFPTVFPFQPLNHEHRDAFVLKITGSVPAFTLRNGELMSWMALGSADSIFVGYTRIQPATGQTPPAGLAIFNFRKENVVVSEATVPPSPLVQNGRVFVEVNGGVNTGLAIANPGSDPASISFFFTDANGQDFGQGTINIPAQGQIARFVNEAPFNGGAPIAGTFTFSSSRPVAVIALRGFTNERSDFLITTLRVAGLSPVSASLIIPHFADGGGWTTQLALVNPTDEPLSGFVEFLGQDQPAEPGQPVTLTVDGQTASRFTWSIAPRSSRQLKTSGASPGTRTGWVLITPATNSKAPSGLGIFSFRDRGVTVTEAGVAAMSSAAAFRVYSETSGNLAVGEPDSIRTGIAVANPSDSPVMVTFELADERNPGTPILSTSSIPPRGHIAMFLEQIFGFQRLRIPFKGLVRISTNAASGISVVGLRGRYNERAEFLITSLAPATEGAPTPGTDLYFPHFVRGGGYSTQFVVFNGSAGETSGSLRFFSQSGQPIP